MILSFAYEPMQMDPCSCGNYVNVTNLLYMQSSIKLWRNFAKLQTLEKGILQDCSVNISNAQRFANVFLMWFSW